MENNRSTSRPLGPLPGRSSPPLSRSRTEILDLLRDQPEPLTQAALVAMIGLHPNTIREHLDGLVRMGLISRAKAEPSGRGRPAWLYQLNTEPGTVAAAANRGHTEYAGLASALASTLLRTSSDPTKDATIAGEDWGRQLVRDRTAPRPGTPAEARESMLDLLDDLGFAPAPDPRDESWSRLTRCPLLEAAHRHPEVVCRVHLGIIRGALTEYGVRADGTELIPFADPGSCRLVVPPLLAEVTSTEAPSTETP